MFPQRDDQADYEYPDDGLLQAYGVVQDDEIRQLQHLDVHGEKGPSRGKERPDHGHHRRSRHRAGVFHSRLHRLRHQAHVIEVAILAYDKQHGPFSAPGDSGSIVLDRKGRIVGLLTGGGGTTDETDVTYATPYWWLNKEMKVKKVYPRCHLYDVVA